MQKFSKENDISELFAEMASFTEQETLKKVIEKVRAMKKILWDDDVKKHTENIIRHNTLDEVLSALTSLLGE